jgi:hypothetical protein
MLEKPLVYIAGPFRAETAWEIEENIRKAERVALEVAEHGGVPVCPHTMYRFFHGTLSDETWLNVTMNLLTVCHAVISIDERGWSEGTNAELREAAKRKIQQFRAASNDLAMWIAGWVNARKGEA